MEFRILVVEDEPDIQELLRLNLSMAGYRVDLACGVDDARKLIAKAPPDLVLCDWNLPGQSGVTLLSWLRSDPSHFKTPVIMVTARDGDEEKVLAFERGADDFVTKPFKNRELLARVGAVLRRSVGVMHRDVLELDGLVLNHAERCIARGEQTLPLGPTEYNLLNYLMRHPVRVHSRDHLLERVWEKRDEVEERVVDVYVGRLRKVFAALGQPERIETVRSAGYRFVIAERRQAGQSTRLPAA
jgi:two-component system phosphate regulon response regulator PhoB